MRILEHVRLSALVICFSIGAWACSPLPAPDTAPEASQISELEKAEQPSFAVKDWGTFKVMLERTTCLGSCPSYFVEITGDGQVRYCGGAYVREAGLRTKTIPVASVRALAEMMFKAKFIELQDEYVGGADAPGQTLWLSFDGRTKKVFELLGEYAGAPRSVREIGQAIDDAVGIRDWVGSPRDNPEGDWEPCFKLAREGITAPAPAPL